jgi:hypothetical protein
MKVALIASLLLLWGGVAGAAEWGTIAPGESTTDGVRAGFGVPSKAEKVKTDGYDTLQWTYEGDRAPAGMIRMFVQFGVLKPSGYQPNVVRTFRLDPKPRVFTRRQIVVGWGKPDKAGTQDGVPLFIYNSGLTVYFDKDIINAVSMWFTAPRPATGAEAAEKPAPQPAVKSEPAPKPAPKPKP